MVKSNFEKFKNFWEEEITKIEKETINTKGSELLYLHFRTNRLRLEMFMEEEDYEKLWLELELLETKLLRALEVAKTRYVIESRSFWVKIFESLASIFSRIPKPRKDVNITKRK